MDNKAMIEALAEILDQLVCHQGIIDRARPVPVEPVEPVEAKPGAAISVREVDKLSGAADALAAMVRSAKGWAEDSAENDEAMDRQDRKPADEQEFALEDIMNMINDAAREVGLAPQYGRVQ